VLQAIEQTAAGTGTGIWNGSNLSIGTTKSGTTYSMTDPARPNLRCGDQSNGSTFSGADDVWGSTSKTDKEAGCTDVMYVAAGEWDMLKNWYGRNGLDGQGSWADALVGLDDVNAYWGSQYNPDGVIFGYDNARNWITATDVVAHEYGHGLDANTPGGISGYPSQEAVADIWGTLSEFYLNNPNDPPDYEIGETINLTGSGPIRYMYQPSKVSGHPDCNSSSLPNEIHASAGRRQPGDHARRTPGQRQRRSGSQ
jgi:Zn-dependent metalloprotease